MSRLAGLVRRLGASNVLAIIGLVLIVLAVAALAGGWWAVLLLGLVFIAMGYVAHRDELQQRRAAPPAAGRRVQ